MSTKPAFPPYFASFPNLGVDGSLSFVKDFQSDPTLAGATGKVHAKTGTYAVCMEVLSNGGCAPTGLLLKGQGFAGYIDTKSGRRLTYQLVVNNVNISGMDDLIQVFQDEGTISAILWRDN